MNTKEDEEHVGYRLEEMLKNELNVSIHKLSFTMYIPSPTTPLLFELVNCLLKFLRKWKKQ